MTETEFLDRKLGEIAGKTVEEFHASKREIDSQAIKAGASGGSRQSLLIAESIKSNFRTGIVSMAEFALRHCVDNNVPREFSTKAFQQAANSLLASLTGDFEKRLLATSARHGGHGPKSQQDFVSKLRSELEIVVESALLDMERGYAGDKQIRAQPPESPTSGQSAATKELEQKFGILFSLSQANRDFDEWVTQINDEEFSIGVLFIDIDHFKNLNEQYTETEVDKAILPEFQNLLKRLVAFRGAGYRHGGEEFVVLLPNQNADEVLAFAEKLRAAVETHRFEVGGSGETLTISIGIAVRPTHGESLTELLGAANKAENEAKKEGRNRVKVASVG